MTIKRFPYKSKQIESPEDRLSAVSGENLGNIDNHRSNKDLLVKDLHARDFPNGPQSENKLDGNKQDIILPLKIRDGGDTEKDIIGRTIEVVKNTAKLGLVNEFDYYKKSIELFKNSDRYIFNKLSDISLKDKNGKINVALRHDIDADVITAIKCAEYLQENAIPGSFFILHTSHYYGQFKRENDYIEFTRHDGFLPFLSGLNQTGVDIGIHNDALGMFFDYSVDGTVAFRNELKWLRSKGVIVRGSVAHNSAYVYGGECFEVFSGMAVADRKYVQWNDRLVPLQTLDQDELGLEYEGNHPKIKQVLDTKDYQKIADGFGDVLRDIEWQRCYFLNHPIFERNYDYDAWLVGKDCWILAGHGDVKYPLSLKQFEQELDKIHKNSRLVVSIHPIYVAGDYINVQVSDK